MIPVSICLTTWNRAAVLPRTLDSILSQTFPDFELIVSDDCSQDTTEEVCRAYEVKDSRVRYSRNQTNLGMPGNLNTAIERAHGTYIANLHDGDIYHPELIAEWKGALDRYPSAAFVFNDYRAVLSDGSEHIYRAPFSALFSGTELAVHYFETVTSAVWGTTMVRASAYQELGLLDPKFGFISDVDLWLRLALHHDVAYVARPLISLGDRPVDHPFRRGLWHAAFWAFGIYTTHLKTFRERIPNIVARYRSSYPVTLRNYFIRTMASCLKHRRWDRIREGLAIWQDAADPILRSIALPMTWFAQKPGWYTPELWRLTLLEEPLSVQAA
jgi:glycosyltransferase involved in cell wall biosynthesis